MINNNRQAQQSDTGKDSNSIRKRLLVADDDVSFLMVASAALTNQGFDVDTTETGEGALAQAVQGDYDAILLDAKMPDMEGFDVCASIHESMDSVPPIIMSTGLDDDFSIDKAFSSGATDYVNKPVNWKIVGPRIASLIQASEGKQLVKKMSGDVDNILTASSDIVFQLNDEAVIKSIHKAELLPAWFKNRVFENVCLFDIIPPESVQSMLAQWCNLLDNKNPEAVLISRHVNDQPFLVEMRFMRSNGSGILCLIRDHTSTYLAEKEIYKLSYMDGITGIGNRKKVQEWLEKSSAYLRDNEYVSVMRCQLADYHELETRLGRSGLDFAVSALAQRLVDKVSPLAITEQFGECRDVLVGRLSDNEFAVLMRCPAALEISSIFSSYLHELLSEPVTVESASVSFDVYIGVADNLQSPGLSKDLLSNAGIALNMADTCNVKKIGIFNAEMEQKIQSRTRLERFLRRDISAKKLDMAYQAKVDTDSRKLVGIEALLRWHCEEVGMVSPGEFIPMAEQCGLMAELSQVVIEKVLDQIVDWEKQGFSGIPISINISGSHLDTSHFVCDLLREIESRQVSPHLIELEVTESIMVDPKGRAITNLRVLRDKGIKISVDDFGTGYSSFSYLRSLPVDVLKIDMSFVKNITHDPKALAIARAIVTVGHDLNLKVVAEGVETEAQYKVLQEMGCDILQGYLTGKPLFSDDFISDFGSNYAVAS